MNAGIKEGMVLAFNPPPIQGLRPRAASSSTSRTGAAAARRSSLEATNALVAAAAKRPELAGVRTTFSANVPQYNIDVDREKAKALDVPIGSIFATMQATFGTLYVNDFTLLGRNYRVSLQSEADFRERPEDLRFVYVQSAQRLDDPARHRSST